jgi:hypothetical protein
MAFAAYVPPSVRPATYCLYPENHLGGTRRGGSGFGKISRGIKIRCGINEDSIEQ